MCVATLSHDLYVCVGETHVHVHPLCQRYYGCSNGTVTKHGSTGYPSFVDDIKFDTLISYT